MRPYMRPDNLTERIALATNLAPVPVAEAMFGMMMSRVVMAAVRLGVAVELAKGPTTADQLAGRLGLDAAGVRGLLRCLVALDHVDAAGDGYSLTPAARKWLDPASGSYVGGFLELNYDQWDWWSRLEDRIRSGEVEEIHERAEDDPLWRRYVTGMFELARLSAPEVAVRLRLPPRSRWVLDLGGGHGWFAAELCRRRPGLRGIVLDLAPSARVGREILAGAGMADRVTHVDGDMMDAPLLRAGVEAYDAVLCFQIVHHLSPEGNMRLLRRVHEVMRPGGTLAVLDYFLPARERRPDAAAFLGLHYYLTSAARTYTEEDLRSWLRACGFGPPRRVPVRSIPLQTVFAARRQ